MKEKLVKFQQGVIFDSSINDIFLSADVPAVLCIMSCIFHLIMWLKLSNGLEYMQQNTLIFQKLWWARVEILPCSSGSPRVTPASY